MRVLCIGDSVVRGTVGVDWISILSARRPRWTFENKGVNGDTLCRIASRLTNCIQQGNKYDAIVLQAGLNDILIPYLRQKSWPFRMTARRLIHKGYSPLDDIRDFETIFRETVASIQEQENIQLILSTLPCLNESPLSPLRGKRLLFNEIIRDIAWDMNCLLADPALLFDEYFERRPTRDYFLQNFMNTACLDRYRCYLWDADMISESRGLHLTIDGVHLNSKGARIFLDEVDKQLLKV